MSQIKFGVVGTIRGMTFIELLKTFGDKAYVYRSTALSATAILGWRSILNNCLECEIPDFTNEEDRKKYENDFVSPMSR